MASVDWCKATTQKAGGMIRHCGEKERIEVNHSNKDIDKSKSHLNIYIGADDYEPMLDKVEARIDEVDKENPPERDLGDKRVTCILLYTPVPQAIADKGKAKEFLQDAHKLFEDFFGAENVGGTCGHFDEVHKYIDKNGKETDSLIHGHTIVAAYAEWTEDVKKSVKQENGRYKQVKTGETRERKGINGKNSVTKERMTKLNKAIDKMCMEKYGISYNTGMGAEKKQTEVLKHESLVRSNEQLQGQIEEHQADIEEYKEHIEDLQGQMGRLSQTVEDLTEQAGDLILQRDSLTDKVDKMQDTIENLKEEELQAHNALLKATKAPPRPKEPSKPSEYDMWTFYHPLKNYASGKMFDNEKKQEERRKADYQAKEVEPYEKALQACREWDSEWGLVETAKKVLQEKEELTEKQNALRRKETALNEREQKIEQNIEAGVEKRIQSIFHGSVATGEAYSLRKYCADIKFKDGTSVLDRFEQRERELEAEVRERNQVLKSSQGMSR